MSSQVTRAPKRRIEKIRNRLNFTISDSQAHVQLHTAEDSKTRVRMIIVLEIQKAITATADYHMLIQLSPAGTAVLTPTISQALDVPAINNLLVEKSGRQITTAAVGENQIIVWDVDSKAMRKLKETDLIALTHIADVASSFSVTGNITLFFKE